MQHVKLNYIFLNSFTLCEKLILAGNISNRYLDSSQKDSVIIYATVEAAIFVKQRVAGQLFGHIVVLATQPSLEVAPNILATSFLPVNVNFDLGHSPSNLTLAE